MVMALLVVEQCISCMCVSVHMHVSLNLFSVEPEEPCLAC